MCPKHNAKSRPHEQRTQKKLESTQSNLKTSTKDSILFVNVLINCGSQKKLKFMEKLHHPDSETPETEYDSHKILKVNPSATVQ